MKSLNKICVSLLLTTAVIWLVSCGNNNGGTSSGGNEPSTEHVYTPSEIYAEVNKSTVFVLLETLTGYSSGTGFFIDDNGTFVTNYHVIEDAVEGLISDYNGNSFTIDCVKGYNEAMDIAICSSSATNTHSARLGNSDTVAVGDNVFAIGYPQAFSLGASSSTFTSGMVSMYRSIDGYSYIQATVDITNGNSGGPLINNKAEVIGITSGGIKFNDIDYMNLSIPINRISNISRYGTDSLYTVTKKHYNMPVKLYVDGVLKDTLQVPYGTRAQLPTYTKNGFHFDGWYKNSSYTSSFSSNSIIDDPMDLYGRFLPNEYHILLNANGGSVSKTSIPVNYGGSYSLPDASRNGYTFSGWYDSNNKKYTSGTYNLTSDLSLTAKWTIVNYSISYELNGGEANSLKSSYTVEESFTLPIPSKNGYTFIGWNTTNSSTGASKSYTIQKGTTGNKKFYAIWNANTYHLHLDVNGGNSLVTTDYDITYDSTFTLPTPTREHYNFVSWTYNGTNVSSGRWKYTSDVTFVAKWEVKTYSISYQLNGGTNNSSNPSKYSYFDSFTLKEPSKTGYSFVGWTGTGINEITKNVSIPYGSTGNRSYTANWSVNTYTITLDPMGAILEEPYTRTFEYGASYTLPTISKPGYTFNGWTYNGNLISNSGKWNIAEDAVLIAKFTPIKYKITYSLSGGSASNPSTYTVEDAFTLNSPVKTGYTFAGWTGSNLSELSSNVVIQKGTTGDLSFEAHWDANKYTLSFDANGGTCSIESMEVTYGETFDIPTPRLSGYTFDGWYYNNKLIDGKTIWSYTNNICVVAKWTKNVTQFTFVYKNDGYELTDCIIKTGSEVLIPDTYNNKPVTAIGEQVFYNNKTITGIIIPDSVKRIGSFNFIYCDNLQFNIDADGCRFLGNDLNPYMVQLSIPGKNGNYTIPNTTKILYSFGKKAEISGIKKLTLPAGLSISNDAYINDSTLEELYICTGDIGTSLDFYKNQNLTYVYICKDVKSFARPIFAMCYNLDDIDFEGTINEWKAISKKDGWNAIDGGWAGDSAGTFHGTTKDITIHCSDGTYIEEGKTFK